MRGAGRRALFAAACASIVLLRGDPRVGVGDDRDEHGERPPEPRIVSGAELDRRAGELALAQRRALVAGALSAPSISWSNLGPTDGFGATPNGIDSGRIRTIVTDPQRPSTIYVATAGGGVFKTTNADAESAADWQWTPITDDIQSSSAAGNVAVGDLAMSPVDSNTLWLAMGDPAGNIPSRGFFITHDGGATWQQGGNTGATEVFKILPLDGSTLLVGTNCGLWRSTDGGGSFVQIPVGGRLATNPFDAMTSALARLPNGRILMGHHGDGGTSLIWTSDDGGLTWTRAAMNHQARNPARLTIATSRASSSIAWAIEDDGIALAPALLRTSDGGSTWNETPISISTFQGAYNQLLIADDDDPQRLFIGTNRLYRTLDGGKTLEELSNVHADQQTATWWTSGGKKRLLVGNDGGLALFKDPVRDLLADRSHNKGLSSFLIYRIGCGPDRTAIGTQDNGTLYSNASTARPGGFTVLIGGDGFYTLVHPVHQNWMLAQLFTYLGRTTDGLEIIEVPRIADPSSVGPVVRDEGDPQGDTVYRAGMHTVYRSTDFGASFTALGTQGLPQTGTILLLAVAPSSRQTIGVIALSEGGLQLFISRDGGSTWTRTHDFSAQIGGTNTLSFDPNDASTLYVTAQAAPFVQRSRDGGRTWEAIDRNGYPAVWSYGIRVDPANSAMLYASNDFGVYWSRDAGASWSRYGQGLPWVSTHDLCIVPGRRAMRVGTYGRGAWEAPLPPPTPLSVSLSNASVVLSPGSQEKIVVSVSHAADLTVTPLPAGVVGTFDPRSVTGPGTATLTLAARAGATATHPTQFTVTASDGPEQAIARGLVSVVVPVSDFSLSLAPATVELESGASQVLAIRTSVTSGVAQSIKLSIEGLPGDTSGRFDRASIDAGDAATLTVTAGSTAVEGDATIVAQSTAVTHRATMHVRVSAPRIVPGPGPTTLPPSGGCDSSGVDPLAMAGLAVLLLRRRRQ